MKLPSLIWAMPHLDLGDEMNREPLLGGGVSNQNVPDPSRVTHIYHHKLDGKSSFFLNTY